MKKFVIDEEKILGAIVVLENYLDGAVADYVNGDVDNVSILEDSIYFHKLLRYVLSPFSALVGDEYEEKYLEKKNSKEEK